MKNVKNIERLLRPKSVAVVGASATPGSLGAAVVDNLDRLQFSGEIHLVNPKRETIGARRCFSSVAALPLGVDTAVLAIPKGAVLQTLRDLAARKVGAAVIFSAGFAEGGAEGLAEQEAIARLAADHDLVIEGPNCLGLVNYVDSIALTFVETPARPLRGRRGVAVVSQSGALAAVVSVTLLSRDIGVSYSVSTGNEAASGVEDYLEYLLDDPHTSVIALIVEHFRQPRQFIEAAKAAKACGKAIVLLHPGRSGAARESAATHTGAMAGNYDVMLAHVKRQGVIVTQGLQEFGDVVELVYRIGSSSLAGTAVLTESGAFKALTLDLCEEVGLELPLVTDSSAPALRAAIPEFVPVSNPVDLTAQGLVDPGLYERTLAALMSDDRFRSIVLAIIQTDEKTSAAKFGPILGALRKLPRAKPVIFAGLDEGARVLPEYIEALRALGVPYFPAPDRAFRALARLTAMNLPSGTMMVEAPGAASGPHARGPELAVSSQLASLPRGVVPEYLAKELLEPLGMAFPPRRFARSMHEARKAAQTLGYPVVLKAQAAALPHKSDAGGVILNLKSAEELEGGWRQLHENLARSRPGLELAGVLVESMSAPGVELIIGGRNERGWGATLLVGFGGVQAEIIKDVALLPGDASISEIEASLRALKGGALFSGYRGSPPLDIGSAARLAASVGTLLSGNSAVEEIDLNPVRVYPEGRGAVALDALMQVG